MHLPGIRSTNAPMTTPVFAVSFLSPYWSSGAAPRLAAITSVHVHLDCDIDASPVKSAERTAVFGGGRMRLPSIHVTINRRIDFGCVPVNALGLLGRGVRC